MNVFWFACSSVAPVCPALLAAKEPDRLVIENGRVTMELTAAAKGSVVSLGDKAVGRELMAASRGSCSSWSFPRARSRASGLR